MKLCFLIDRQRQIGKQFAKKKPGAGAFVDQHCVLADPAESGFLGKCAFQYGGAIHKRPIAEITRVFANAFCKLLQAAADEFVIVTTQCVT